MYKLILDWKIFVFSLQNAKIKTTTNNMIIIYNWKEMGELSWKYIATDNIFPWRTSVATQTHYMSVFQNR